MRMVLVDGSEALTSRVQLAPVNGGGPEILERTLAGAEMEALVAADQGRIGGKH
ncbi:unnamed protein product [Nippostrongylus brasiliensis]|uniref:MOSC domain-containing protein n=1 Tax=Nippostrongylus brasiliensis TaxID=27835 RepID=A0A0N4XNH6_NIPBR|nr:unnamed protein product [Nippostrongylus brasiliensis]